MGRDKDGTGKKISAEDQKLYRSGVGMLLYLVKHSRPDIANPVRELSKVLDGASPAAFKEMKRVIRYVIDTEDWALKIFPKIDEDGIWRIVVFSDSDYATDPETRISVSGFVLYVCGVPVSWASRGQKSVTLSSTEAEYVALSEAAKEVKFVYQLMTEIGIEVKLPITIRVDNVGAIFMAENNAISNRTKHVDTRLKFVNQFVEDKFVEVIFVKTDQNDADMYTKNLGGALHKKHSNKMIGSKFVGD